MSKVFNSGLLTALALAGTVLASGAAQAERMRGLYIGAGAGLNLLDSSFDRVGAGTAINPAVTTRIAYAPGYVGVLSLGYGFGNGFRAEIEGNFRSNEVDRTERAGRSVGRSGATQSYGGMVNVYYEFETGALKPYLGLGVGYIFQDPQNAGSAAPNSRGGTRINGSDGAFAYQAIVGVVYPLTAVPGLALTGEFRFLGDTGHTYNTGLAPRTNGRFDSENFNYSLLVGVRYNFGQVAAAPNAPPAGAAAGPTRTYLVFFDFDRADLTERARQIIAEAAAAAPRVQATRIEVAGHADRSGTPAYNQGLSQRRANNVAAELVRRGIARNQIAVSAFGETRPLVPTADGVREPQNRRVEIVLR